MSVLAPIAPYVDGYIGPLGVETTIVPRVRFPFKPGDTYSRLYERDYEVMPGSMPRIDQRTAWTNLLTYSEDTDNAAWTKTNLSVTANNTTAPNGETTMDKLLETSSTGEHSIAQAATVTAAAHEVSFFVKGGLTRAFVRAAFTDSAATVFSSYFSLSGYAVSPSAGVTAKIVGLGNGHFHCTLQFTPAAGAGTLKINVATAVGTISYAGSTSAGVYLWGMQVALGSLAPYASTTSATRTILAPDRDPRDPLAFLLMESDPEPVSSHRERVTRTFGRIPRTQVNPGTRYIPKPQLSGTFPRTINGVVVDQPDADTPEYVFFSEVDVTSDSGAPTFGITGGDYDVTVGAGTASAIAFDAAAATLQTALNALPAISDRSSVAVTGGPSTFRIQFSAWAATTADVSGLTGSLSKSATIAYRTPTGIADPFRQWVSVTLEGGYFTAGTFVLNVLGEDTAPIAYDASIQDIKDAVDALSVIGSGTEVFIPSTTIHGYSGKPLPLDGWGIQFTLKIPFPSASADGANLTPSGTATMTPQEQFGSVDGVTTFGWFLTLTSGSSGPRTITAENHGVTAGEDIVLRFGTDTLIPLTGNTYTIASANALTLTSASGVAYYTGSAATAVLRDSGNRYAADSPQIPIEQTTTYYMAGVSPDISEAADIPIPARVTPAQLLGAIFGGSTLANYEVGEIEPWETYPILSITLTTINPQHLVSPDA